MLSDSNPMRSNSFNLLACFKLFGAFFAAGLLHGMIGGEDHITSGLFIAAYATLIAGVIWNALLFAAGTSQRRRHQWAEEGRCLNCGYDLTANQSGVCPECGTQTSNGGRHGDV